jgi:8-oxo-dGTP diphosphatase
MSAMKPAALPARIVARILGRLDEASPSNPMPPAGKPVGFYIDDVQDYVTLLLVGGANEVDTVKKTRAKFKLKKVTLNPIGRVVFTEPKLDERPFSSTAMDLQGGMAPMPGEEPVPGEEEPAAPAPPPPPPTHTTTITTQAGAPPKVEGITEAEYPPKQPGELKKAAGGVVINKQGRVLLREPLDHFGGYVWTFAKGRIDAGETAAKAAKREVAEETGWTCKIVDKIGDYKGDVTTTTFFLMTPVSDSGELDAETASIVWATPEKAAALIQKTTTPRGRERDMQVLRDAFSLYDKQNKTTILGRLAKVFTKFFKATEEDAEEIDEMAPPGFSGTVTAMKKHKEIKNPYALAWGLYKKGAKPRKAKEAGKPRYVKPTEYFKARAKVKENFDVTDAEVAFILEHCEF